MPDGGTRTGQPSSVRASLCRIGLHRWPRLGTTKWLNPPTIYENRLGVAMEYRACERCGRLRDVTTWFATADPDLGIPMGMGPLAGARFLEIVNGPRVPLPGAPILMETAE